MESRLDPYSSTSHSPRVPTRDTTSGGLWRVGGRYKSVEVRDSCPYFRYYSLKTWVPRLYTASRTPPVPMSFDSPDGSDQWFNSRRTWMLPLLCHEMDVHRSIPGPTGSGNGFGNPWVVRRQPTSQGRLRVFFSSETLHDKPSTG